MKNKAIGKMKYLQQVLLMMLVWFIPFGAMAQSYSLKGTVVDNKGITIPGVNILIKGTTNGVATDIDGNFELIVDKGNVLVVSFTGYKTQEVPVTGQNNLKITLLEDIEQLEEVVVIGYGTLKKSDLTGAIASVDGETLANKSTINPAEALQGQVPGVSVARYGGLAGQGVSVKIRGVGTYGSSEPLYIIDGFPGDISTLAPQDIKSMEILKDGAAGAIYGSVAANGVVIITTKSGKKGEVKVDINSYVSIKKVTNLFDMLDAEGFRKLGKMMHDEYNKYAPIQKPMPGYVTKDPRANTDWQDEVFRTGFAQSHSVSVRGGGDVTQFSISANVYDEQGIVLDNDFLMQNGRMKINTKKSIFDISANLAYTAKKYNNPDFALSEVYRSSPLTPVLDPTQKYGYGIASTTDGLASTRNPVADAHFRHNKTKVQDVVASFAVAANFTKWLQFKTSYYYNGTNTQYYENAPDYIASPTQPDLYPYVYEKRTYWQSQVIDNYITFNDKFGKHAVTAMVGVSVQMDRSSYDGLNVEGKTTVDGKDEPAGFPNPNWNTPNAGVGGTYTGEGTRTEYNRLSYFGRINYSYADRYLLQVTVRRDGSSKFGPESRWATFPSVAVGWRISEEEFFPKNTIISNLKLRGSWGQLGNEGRLKLYEYLALMTQGNGGSLGYVQGTGKNPWVATIANMMENRGVKWETSESMNIGLDYALFDGKLSGYVNYYNNKTRDLLIPKVLAPSAGIGDPTLNVGTMQNTGIELDINYRESRGELNWNAGFNIAFMKNKVKEMANKNQILYGSYSATQTRSGKAIATFYLYETDGIFQNMAEVYAHSKDGKLIQPNAKPGDIRFKDNNGNGEIDAADKVAMGCGAPKVEANLSLGLEYKGFDFSALFGSGWGHKIYNYNRVRSESMDEIYNMFSSTLNAWTPENRNTNMPRAVLGDPNQNKRESDRFLEDGDFIRLRQIQLGYTLPKAWLNKINMEKIRVYVSADNLWTWTKYSGVDPEFAQEEVLNTGIDSSIYPFTKSCVFGLQVTF
ncbi:TonB-dependent receptor [Culturomica sp.]|uniref:SusC/RagA family TonB-linked outer membrane protein n=1 Tax=Culturomica sp. TaxID=1926652 RepID=UPI000E895EF8|nr:TonB-dependent receptor [Culturomica sp.]HBO26581.1 SusC/RagA family TonB-linked outer membrane protein [Culturomica sp.]